MINSLRKKFILVAMCSTFVVLAVIMGIVNVVNYIGMLERADGMTALFVMDDGALSGSIEAGPPQEPSENEETGNGEAVPKIAGPEGITAETPYETRYFSVTLDEEGTVQTANMEHIAAVTEEQAEEFAMCVFAKGHQRGFLGIYRYRMEEVDGETKILFLDCRRELESFRNFAFASVGASAFGLLAVLLLVIFFSRLVLRPVAESYEKQKQFITDASHEIKTPLTIIDANTEVIEMENGESQWTRSTRKQVKRLSALTGQLVTLARMEEERGMEHARFSLSDAVLESVRPYEAAALAGGKQLSLEIQEQITFTGDERSIRQMVGILMDNAVKYCQENGRIRVTLKQSGKKNLLEVFNETEKIDQGKQEVLFERFYRRDASRNSSTGGSGIGLSVAKAVVTAHRGKITAFSSDGKSLLVRILL